MKIQFYDLNMLTKMVILNSIMNVLFILIGNILTFL